MHIDYLDHVLNICTDQHLQEMIESTPRLIAQYEKDVRGKEILIAMYTQKLQACQAEHRRRASRVSLNQG